MARAIAFILALLALGAVLGPVPGGPPSAQAGTSGCGAQDDAGSGRDATPEEPVGLPDGTSSACLDPTDREDVFTIATRPGDVLNVSLAAGPCNEVEIHLAVPDIEGYLSSGSVHADRDEINCVRPWVRYHASQTEPAVLWVEALNSSVDYSLDVNRSFAPLADLAVASVHVEAPASADTPFGDVELATRLDRQRTVRVDFANLGDGTARVPVSTIVYVLPRDCVHERQGLVPLAALVDLGERDPCDPEVLYRATFWGGWVAGAHRMVEVAWDTTPAFGDQVVVAGIDAFPLPEHDRANNQASTRTYVWVSGQPGAT